MFLCYFGMSASACLPLATAIDRFMAIVAPIKYKTVGKSFLIILLSISWGYALIDSAFTFYSPSGYDIQLNCNIASTTEIGYVVRSSCAIAIATLIVIVYVCILLLIRYQHKSVKCDYDNIFEIKSKVHLKVLKSLSVVSVIHLFTQVATRVGLTAVPALVADNDKWTPSSFMRIICFVGLSATFFVFMKMNYEFNESFWKLVPFLKNRILPLDTVPAQKGCKMKEQIFH